VDGIRKLEDMLDRWKESHELSLVLSETVFILLDRLVRYSEEHKIPIRDEGEIWRPVESSRRIFGLIEDVDSGKPLTPKPRKLTARPRRERSPEDLTEPAEDVLGGIG